MIGFLFCLALKQSLKAIRDSCHSQPSVIQFKASPLKLISGINPRGGKKNKYLRTASELLSVEL